MHAAYAQYSIDNRPKKIAIKGVDFSAPDKDEMLRHFLLVCLTPSFNDHAANKLIEFGRV